MDNKRISKWDNIKFFMIVCVVIGHTIYRFIGSSDLAKSIYLFIYTFHMPVFIFIAGMFSKNTIQKKRYEVVFEYLLIYVFMKFLETVGYYLAKGRIRFHFFWEDGPAWFALAMAAFLVATMLFQDFDYKYMMIVTVFIGCLAGLDNHLGDHFVSMRICVFYPVFLAGYYIKSKIFELKELPKLTRSMLRLCAFLFLNGCLFLCLTRIDILYPFIKLLKGKYTYEEMGFGIEGVLIRLACYVFWIGTISAVLLVNSEKNRIYTWLGKRTMSVFIWHNLILVMLLDVFKRTAFIKKEFSNYYVWSAFCVACIIAVVTSYLPQIRIADKLKLKKNKERGEG